MFRLFKQRLMMVSAVLAVAAASVVASAGPASASTRSATCTNGPIASGTYRSITVTGNCWIPDKETVIVKHNLTVSPGATLNGVAFTNGKLDLSHFNMATIHVHGNVIVGQDAILGLGCSVAMALDPMMPFPLCSPEKNSDVVISGNLVALAPRTMYLDGITVHGNVISVGGGPGSDVTQQDAAFNFPVKDITVGNNLVLVGWTGGWMGAIRDKVGGNLIYLNNVGKDPDANEIITDIIGKNLICDQNSPATQYGDAQSVPGAAPNVVGGRALGQCAALTSPFTS